ncbi:MarR family winged helix-turn-helix transcriptional regulator [Paenibacillus hodogayensis]|uniref:MarR family winged helix-turn-helix transcriptional regulator n=1 Tax=Paenibacillus hodogayensis TaxID=279208 RepID=A0ABV5VQL1_9BACL
MPETGNELLELSSMFKSLVKKMTHEWNRRMSDSFTMTHFRTLYILNAKGPQKAADLAETLCVTSGAITGLADKLIARQLLERQRSEDDRRVVYLSITQEGKDVLEQLLNKQRELISLLFQGLPKEDVEHLKRIFTIMLEHMDQLEKE